MTDSYFNLSAGDLTQDWSNLDQIIANDDWSGVPSITGYLGDISPTAPTGVNPTTLTGPALGAVDVIANQTNTALNAGGVAEFQIANPTIALQGSGTADAPGIVTFLNATGRQAIRFQATLRDIDATAGEDAMQQIAIQYRTSPTGDWTNVPGGYFADVTGAGATQTTAVDLTLPGDANDAATLQIRIFTTNAVGADEWVGIDDIVVSSAPLASADPGTLSIADASVSEGDAGTAAISFVVTRAGGSAGAVSADYAVTLPGGAGGADAADLAGALTGTVTFADGEVSRTITLQVAGDTAVEPDETFTVTLSAPTGGAAIGDGTATGTILNDDVTAPPAGASVWINEFHYDDLGGDTGEFIEIAGLAGTDLSQYSIVRYNGGTNGANAGAATVYTTPAQTTVLTGTIEDAGNGYGAFAVRYPVDGLQNGPNDGFALVRTVDGVATVVEFLSYEGVITAGNGPAAGLTSTDVGVVEAGTAEGTSIGRTGGATSGFVLFEDDTPGAFNTGQVIPGAAFTPSVRVTDVSVSEGVDGGLLTFTVLRANATDDAFTVDFATADGSAIAGSDYVATSGTLAFAAGQQSATVTIAIINDTLAEADESFFLNLSNPVGATIADAQGQATIRNDDGIAGNVSINDVSIVEGEAGTSIATFTVTREGGTGAFTVDFATADGTASAGSDYVATGGRLSFAEGQTTAQVQVTINGDTIAEADETFAVNLSNATGGATITDAQGTATILTDEFRLIHDIQGSAYFSPILAAEGVTAFNRASTTTVTVRAVVTAVDGEGARQGFYLTEEYADWDASDLTSEGIFVMARNDSNAGVTLASLAPGLAVGDVVTVTAQVMEYQFGQNLPRTVLTNPTGVTKVGSGATVPTLLLDATRPIPNAILTGVTPDYRDSADDAGDTFDAANYALSFFETVEGMLVTVPDMVIADGFLSRAGGQPFFQAYSTVHADADQINSRGGYTIAGDPPASPPDTATPLDDTRNGGRVLHDGDTNPDLIELDFTDFAIDAPAGLVTSASMGDRLGDVTGIIDFDFTDRKLYVTGIDPTKFVNSQPVQETTALGGDARSLTVATFNVENLDPTDGPARFTALAGAIANNLKAPDIISIEEIQDNNGAAAGDGISATGTDASMTWTMLVDALNAAVPGANYTWVDEAPVYNAEGGEPGGNIRVGFLYNQNRVQLGDLAAGATIEQRRAYTDRIGDGTRDAGDRIAYDDSQIAGEINTADWNNTRKSLLGEFTFNGNAVYVVANHWPSKGGSGQPYQFNQDLEAGQPANSGWAARAQIGQDVYTMLNRIEATRPDAGIVSGGDYNDFYFYRPLETVTGYVTADGVARTGGARFENLTLTLPEAERYTYTFDGRSQAIDHVIVDRTLGDIATYDVVHINTGYNDLGTGADANPALSDHDPAVASFNYRNLAETLNGTAGADTIDGFGGNDTLFGLAGNDVLRGGAGNDRLDGGAGTDTAAFTGNRADYRFAIGSDGRLTVTDQVVGRDGTDSLTGIEQLSFADGSVNATPISGASYVAGGTGNDILFATGPAQLAGNGGGDILNGSSGIDVIYGSIGNDILIGNGGRDTFLFTGQDLRVGAPGEVDRILDFEGAGAGPGDNLTFRGFGAGSTFALVGNGAAGANGSATFEYRLTDTASGRSETIFVTSLNGQALSTADYAFYAPVPAAATLTTDTFL